MNGTFFYIGLGLGLAAACGLRPFFPLLLAGALASAGALGVELGPAGQAFHFLEADWWLLVVTVALVLAYALQLLLGLAPTLDTASTQLPSGSFAAALTLLGLRGQRRRQDALASAVAGLGLGAGALLFEATLSAHGDSSWPGLIGGFLVVGLAQRASGPVIVRARTRLPDRAAREAVTVYLDAASLLLAGLVVLVHPLGYVALALLAWFLWRGRARSGDDRYAGLRILRK
jgi:hypothetical protein